MATGEHPPREACQQQIDMPGKATYAPTEGQACFNARLDRSEWAGFSRAPREEVLSSSPEKSFPTSAQPKLVIQETLVSFIPPLIPITFKKALARPIGDEDGWFAEMF